MNLLFLLSLTSILCWADSSPIKIGSLEFDSLDTDISDLKYPADQSNEGDLDDFFKTPDKKASEESDSESDSDKSNTKVNVSGSKEKKVDNKGLNIKYNLEDLKKFLKQIGFHDAGSYDDGAIFGIVKNLFAKGIGVSGNEETKYKKGLKSKGFHKVSHKDEYNKENEFFEDDETSGVIKKIGAKGLALRTKGGAGFQKGYFHHDHDKELLGKQGVSGEGTLNKEYKGYSDSEGFNAYFK